MRPTSAKTEEPCTAIALGDEDRQLERDEEDEERADAEVGELLHAVARRHGRDRRRAVGRDERVRAGRPWHAHAKAHVGF